MEEKIEKIYCDRCKGIISRKVNGEVQVEGKVNHIEMLNNKNLKTTLDLCDNCLEDLKAILNVGRR